MTAMTDEKRVSELLPCPFCGTSGYLRIRQYYVAQGEIAWGHYVVCDASGLGESSHRGCGASGAWGETSSEAIAAWNRRSQVPDGWRLVPVEPTKEMVDAGLKRNTQNPHPWCPAVYRAMLAAAPIPQSNEAK